MSSDEMEIAAVGSRQSAVAEGRRHAGRVGSIGSCNKDTRNVFLACIRESLLFARTKNESESIENRNINKIESNRPSDTLLSLLTYRASHETADKIAVNSKSLEKILCDILCSAKMKPLNGLAQRDESKGKPSPQEGHQMTALR